MRARLARPRRIIRGRLVAPVAAAAAVALVAGVVVATPDAPTVRGDVQTVATVSAGNASAAFSYNFSAALGVAELAGVEITDINGLPEGLTYDGQGGITGKAVAGTYPVTVIGTRGGEPVAVSVTLTINNADGTPPAGAAAGSAAEGSLGGQAQADGQITTGSDGTDAILGAVVSIVTSLGGEAAAELVTGSVGGGETIPEGPVSQPSAPLGSDANGQLNLGSLGNGTPDGGPENPNTGSGSSGNAEAGGNVEGGLDTQSLGPLGSLIDTEGGIDTTGSTTGGEITTGGEVDGDLIVDGNFPAAGQIEIPGSSSPVDTGSLGTLAPGLAFTGAALLGLAGLGLALSGGSSTPGSTAILPALPGSTTTGGTTTGGSSGSTAPTVAAGAPAPVQAPGPTVANGRG